MPLSPVLSVPRFTVRQSLPQLTGRYLSLVSLLLPPAFYTNTSKQVLDVHEEALRIKESKKNAATQQAAPTAGTGIPTPASSEEKPLQTTAAPLV